MLNKAFLILKKEKYKNKFKKQYIYKYNFPKSSSRLVGHIIYM